jgi:hypothetical protein
MFGTENGVRLPDATVVFYVLFVLRAYDLDLYSTSILGSTRICNWCQDQNRYHACKQMGQ